MSNSESKIVTGTGISVGGNGPASIAVLNAMTSAALAAHAAGHDDEAAKAAMLNARSEAKPVERR